MEYQRKLPHFDHKGAIFFVTFRLHNSIPTQIAKTLKLQRSSQIAAIKSSDAKDKQQQIYNVERGYFLQFESLLDHPTYGERYLSEPACAETIENVLNEYANKYYKLGAYCIMPNHVHLLIDTSLQLDTNNSEESKYQYLHDIMRRIKSKTAVLLNRQRKNTEKVWQEESYDRYIRNFQHYMYVENYIIQNPIKAGLGTTEKPYPYVYVNNIW